MDKIELETKQDENTINDIAEKLGIVSNTKMVTKEELLQNFVAEDARKSKMINVAVQMIIEYEKRLNNSDKIMKGNEDYIGDNEIRRDKLDKVCGDNVNESCSEKDEVYEKKFYQQI